MKPNDTHGLRKELQAILIVYVGTILGGYSMGFSAVAIPDIKRISELGRNASDFFLNIPGIQASDEQLSWFASSVNIGQMIGCIIGGICGGRFGPKRTVLLSGIPGILGWLCMALSPNLIVLLVGRVLCGFASSVTTANCSLLVAQYSTIQRRGIFLGLFALMVGIGILLCYSLGAGLGWRYVACFPVVCYLFFMLGLLPIPESPIWLLSHKGRESAFKALTWLRANEAVLEEIEELEKTREKQKHGLTMIQALRNLSRPDIRKPFLLITCNFCFVMFTGPFAMIFYAIQIFQESGIDANEHLAAIVVAAIRVVGGIAAIVLIKKLPRLKQAMLTMSLMSLAMAVLGGVMYLQDLGFKHGILRVLPIICVTIYMFSFGAGAGPLQWVFVGELLPPEYKVLSGVITCISTFAIFIITKIFPTLLLIMKPYGTYWLFALVGFSSNAFYSSLMPETKGMSMLEIKELFHTVEQDKSDK